MQITFGECFLFTDKTFECYGKTCVVYGKTCEVYGKSIASNDGGYDGEKRRGQTISGQA